MRLRPLSRGVKWVAEQSIHLTLKFLGEATEEAVAAVSKTLAAVSAEHRPFNVSVHGIGAFPSMRHPNVLWVGMDCPEELQTLHRDIDEALSVLGFEREERRFSPHLTIGRVKEKKGVDLVVKELSTFDGALFGTIHVAEVVLMRSTLKPSGAEYSPITVCRLGAGNS